jgi:hypothetical protein
MHLGSCGRIRRLLAHHRMNSPRKESLLPFAAIRVHVSGVDEIAFLKFVRHLICSDLLW